MHALTSSLILPAPKRQDDFSHLKRELEKQGTRGIKKALHRLSRLQMDSKQRAHIFPVVVNLITHSSIEIKGAAYAFLSRIVLGDKSTLLMSTNILLKELRGESGEAVVNTLSQRLALEFIAKNSDPEFLCHFLPILKRAMGSQIREIRRAALLSIPSLNRAFQEFPVELLLSALRSKDPSISGRALKVVAENTIEGVDMTEAFSILCGNREDICEYEDFSLLFHQIIRKFSSVPHSCVSGAVSVFPFLRMYVVRSFAERALDHPSGALFEEVLISFLSFLPTDKTEALEAILWLLERKDIPVDLKHFLIDSTDTRAEKVLKIKILSKTRESEAVEEVRASLKDVHATFHALSVLIEGGHATKEDIQRAFVHPDEAVLALYRAFPLPASLLPTASEELLPLFNLRNKEAYLYLAGHLLGRVPEEAKRIGRIRKSKGPVRYGSKDERDSPEEHLDEYLFFLVNLFRRGVLDKDETLLEGGRAFEDEPVLLRKFLNLTSLDKGDLEEIVGFKRIFRRVEGCQEFAVKRGLGSGFGEGAFPPK
jgi:Adaptin N terminal region